MILSTKTLVILGIIIIVILIIIYKKPDMFKNIMGGKKPLIAKKTDPINHENNIVEAFDPINYEQEAERINYIVSPLNPKMTRTPGNNSLPFDVSELEIHEENENDDILIRDGAVYNLNDAKNLVDGNEHREAFIGKAPTNWNWVCGYPPRMRSLLERTASSKDPNSLLRQGHIGTVSDMFPTTRGACSTSINTIEKQYNHADMTNNHKYYKIHKHNERMHGLVPTHHENLHSKNTNLLSSIEDEIYSNESGK
jgi:hypothetical protein